MNTINGLKTGRFFVNTEHSAYGVDLDGHTVTRIPFHDGAAFLRGDCDPVTLVEVRLCRVGLPAIFILDGLAPEGETIRTTTRVVSIEAAA